MDIKVLVENGFLIYMEKNEIIVEKKATPLNKKRVDRTVFYTIEDSLKFIEEFINKKEWKAIVRYNRGLGIEYKNLGVFEADSIIQAKETAKKNAESILKDYNIIEIKVTENF
jgi:hypothetical protein